MLYEMTYAIDSKENGYNTYIILSDNKAEFQKSIEKWKSNNPDREYTILNIWHLHKNRFGYYKYIKNGKVSDIKVSKCKEIKEIKE